MMNQATKQNSGIQHHIQVWTDYKFKHHTAYVMSHHREPTQNRVVMMAIDMRQMMMVAHPEISMDAGVDVADSVVSMIPTVLEVEVDEVEDSIEAEMAVTMVTVALVVAVVVVVVRTSDLEVEEHHKANHTIVWRLLCFRLHCLTNNVDGNERLVECSVLSTKKTQDT